MGKNHLVLVAVAACLIFCPSCGKKGEETYVPSKGVPRDRYDGRANRIADPVPRPTPPSGASGETKRTGKEVEAAFFEAVKEGNVILVNRMVTEEGASIDARDEHGISAWEWAVFYMNVGVMKYLRTLAAKARDSCFNAVGVKTLETDHFTVLSMRGEKPALMIADAAERFARHFSRAFSEDLPAVLRRNRVLIRFFARSEDFQSFSKARQYFPDNFVGVSGMYRSDDNIVYYHHQGNRLHEIITLRHELAHAFLELMNASTYIPPSLNEGLAMYMTLGGYWDGKVQHMKHESFLYWLKKHMKKNIDNWTPTAEFLALDPGRFYCNPKTADWNYLQAWATFYLLADMAGEGRNKNVGTFVAYHFKAYPEEGWKKQAGKALEDCFGVSAKDVDERAKAFFR